MNAIRTTTAGLVSAWIATLATAQPKPGVTVDWSQVDQRIAWYGTWNGALEAAERTKRPILLVSAAPHCHHVPGVW